jgi:hypothetical protein
MDEVLLRRLLEFNKGEPVQVTPELEVVPAKVYGGAGLSLMGMRSMLSLKQPKPVIFWSGLAGCVDGSEHITELRTLLSEEYKLLQVLDAIQYMFMKPGYTQTDRPFVMGKPAEVKPIDSTIYFWSEDGSAHAQSDMVFIYSELPTIPVANFYKIKTSKHLGDLVAVIKADNFREGKK